MRKNQTKKFLAILLLFFIIGIVVSAQNFSETQKANAASFPIIINDNGLEFKILTKENSVQDVLEFLNIQTIPEDIIIPTRETLIFSSSKIFIIRAVPINLIIDGESRQIYTTSKKISGVICENNISLGEKDRIEPDFESFVFPNIEIKIIRTIEKTVVEKISVLFEKIIQKDENLNWGGNKIIQKGENGEKEQTFKIIYENGEEASRKLLEEKILTEPKNQIEIQGTKITVGNIQEGTATWYAKGLWNPQNLTAASNTFPRKTYLKVTNLENNKSVIVKVNDCGAFQIPIVIDLSSGAFKKLAPLGAGKISVRVEEII